MERGTLTPKSYQRGSIVIKLLVVRVPYVSLTLASLFPQDGMYVLYIHSVLHWK